MFKSVDRWYGCGCVSVITCINVRLLKMTIRIKFKSGKELTKYVPDYAAANLIKRDPSVYMVWDRQGKRV